MLLDMYSAKTNFSNPLVVCKTYYLFVGAIFELIHFDEVELNPQYYMQLKEFILGHVNVTTPNRLD